MKFSLTRVFCLVLFAVFLTGIAGTVSAQKKMDRIERERMLTMLKNIKGAIKKDYFDPEYKGIDIDTRFGQAEEKLKTVETFPQSMAVIAQVLMDFDDSHLYFYPPATNLEVEYGWRVNMYGDKAFITFVKPKSDAADKGLKVGDQVLAIEGFRPSRKEMWKAMYYYNVLSKRPGLKLIVQSPGSDQPKELAIEAKVKTSPKTITRELLLSELDKAGREELEYNYFKQVGPVMVWKMPSFAIDASNIDKFVSRVKNSPSLILDLRGNGGGLVETMERLASFMFDKDLTIAELKGRKKMEPQASKTKGADSYKGKLVVLIDSESGSASEIFARLVQLEKRGIVVGDVSSGSVMQSRGFATSTGANSEVYYGASIPHADVIMSDGKSLEHVGVTPDELVIPTGADLAALRDPMLAKALTLLGAETSPDAAGKFFHYIWREDDRFEIEVR